MEVDDGFAWHMCHQGMMSSVTALLVKARNAHGEWLQEKRAAGLADCDGAAAVFQARTGL